MGITYIPPELICEVLGHLQADKQALKSCSLVCKAWVYPSRSHLFAEVVLEHKLVERFLPCSTAVIPYIRRFHLKESPSDRIKLWNDWIPVLVGFQQVESLTLQISLHCLNAQARSALITQFAGIVRLCIRGERYSSEMSENQLADTICSFPGLEVLTLHGVPGVWSTPTSGENIPLSPRTIPRHLHTLEITDNQLMKQLTWILSFENNTALRALSLSCNLGSFRTLNKLLANLSSLEKLSIGDLSLPIYGSEFMDLRHHERLRFLHFRRIALVDRTKFVIQTLGSISSTTMDEIVFDISLDGGGKDIKWSEVDAVLQSPQFSELRTVQINTVVHQLFRAPSAWELWEYYAWLCSRLSKCKARGILSLRKNMHRF